MSLSVLSPVDFPDGSGTRLNAGVDGLRLEFGAVPTAPGPLNIDVLSHVVHMSTKVNRYRTRSSQSPGQRFELGSLGLTF